MIISTTPIWSYDPLGCKGSPCKGSPPAIVTTRMIIFLGLGVPIHPRKLTWIPKMMIWKRWLLLNMAILVSMLNFWGVTLHLPLVLGSIQIYDHRWCQACDDTYIECDAPIPHHRGLFTIKWIIYIYSIDTHMSHMPIPLAVFSAHQNETKSLKMHTFSVWQCD